MTLGLGTFFPYLFGHPSSGSSTSFNIGQSSTPRPTNNIAEIAYQKPEDRPQQLQGYTLNQRFSSPEDAVYVNPTSKKVVVGFRGTDNMTDVGTDATGIALGMKDSDPRFYNSNRLVQTLKHVYPDYTIETTGHSLGGNLSKYVAEKNPDVKGIGYNTGSFVPDLFKQNPSNFTSIRTSNDVVSLFDRPSNTGGVIQTDTLNPLASHSVKYFSF